MMGTRAVGFACVVVPAIILGVACGPSSRPGTAVEKKEARPSTPPTKLTVKGTLVRENAKPFGGASVMVHKSTPESLTIEIEEGVVKNPGEKSDATGHFVIEVDRSFLPKNGRIMLSIWAPGFVRQSVLQDEKGSPIEFVVDAQTREIDFGKIVVRIVVKD